MNESFTYQPGSLPVQMRDELEFIGMAVGVLQNMDDGARQRVLDYLSAVYPRIEPRIEP